MTDALPMRCLRVIFFFLILAGYFMAPAMAADAVSGICGPSAGTMLYGWPVTTGLCEAGVPVQIKQGNGRTDWKCAGANGGAYATCTAGYAPRTSGKCFDNGKAAVSVPPQNLCAVGTPDKVVQTTTSFIWNCAGAFGGTVSHCAVPYVKATAQCGSSHQGVVASAASLDLCKLGTPTAVAGTTKFSWSCNAGSSAAFCSATLYTAPGTNVSFLSNYLQTADNQGWTRSLFNWGGWQFVQAMSPDRIQLDKTNLNHGMPSMHITVKPGDNPINSSGERTEFSGMMTGRTLLTENANSHTQYIAVSYKFPAGYDANNYADKYNNFWAANLQLHGPDTLGMSPDFAFGVGRTVAGGVPVYAANFFSGAIPYDLYKAGKATAFVHKLAFKPGTNVVVPDKWTDFIIVINFDVANGSGQIWRRDEGHTGFEKVAEVAGIPTLQTSDKVTAVGEHYWKQGLYRNVQPGRTNELWIGPTARATTFEAAELAAFGTRDGKLP